MTFSAKISAMLFAISAMFGLSACSGGGQEMEEALSAEDESTVSESYDEVTATPDYETAEETVDVADAMATETDASAESVIDAAEAAIDEEVADVELAPEPFSDNSLPMEEPTPVASELVAEVDDASQEAPSTSTAAPKTVRIAKTQQDMSGKYIVRPGDTLADIAKRVYGSYSRWRDLASENQIADPQVIFPGDVIRFDTDSSTNDAEFAAKKSVTVKTGDTLASISQTLFGTEGGWKYLWQLNAEKIENPNRIFAGQVLRYHSHDERVSH